MKTLPSGGRQDREKIQNAEQDRALFTALESASRMYANKKFAEARLVLQRALAVRPSAGAWVTPAERARRLGSMGPKISTGIGVLDHVTRGGLRAGKLVVIGGGPGSAKTTLVTGWALRFARAGHRVVVVAADEGASGLLVRMGQATGAGSRDELEDGQPEAKDRLAATLEEIPGLSLVDAGEDEAIAVEDAAEHLISDAAAGDAPGILIVDSIQTARTRDDDAADGERMRVGGIVRVLRSAARHGLLVVATSEVSRASYRSRVVAERADPLASFRESSAIEFGADVAVFLASVKGEGNAIDLDVVKNRLGPRDSTRLSLDRTTATLIEIDVPAPEKAIRPDVGDRVAAAIELVRGELRAQPGRHGKRTMRQALRGKALQDDVDDAIATLLQADEIVATGPNKNKPQWRLVEKQEGGPNGVLPS
jgi:KaiC/GvpD/RAD55 family RecA-like ATPase